MKSIPSKMARAGFASHIAGQGREVWRTPNRVKRGGTALANQYAVSNPTLSGRSCDAQSGDAHTFRLTIRDRRKTLNDESPTTTTTTCTTTFFQSPIAYRPRLCNNGEDQSRCVTFSSCLPCQGNLVSLESKSRRR